MLTKHGKILVNYNYKFKVPHIDSHINCMKINDNDYHNLSTDDGIFFISVREKPITNDYWEVLTSSDVIIKSPEL